MDGVAAVREALGRDGMAGGGVVWALRGVLYGVYM